jgi:SulP family sulfate permease
VSRPATPPIVVHLTAALRRRLPAWTHDYTRATFADDATAAVVVTIMLIPQSLAYALLAGMPPEAGLYASIAPLVVYAALGTSRALAVGPVAVVSLMTAAAVGEVARQGTADYAAAALVLAFLSGAILLAMGALRLGVLAGFLSHPVVSGFVTASGILIAAGQVKHLLGVPAHGETLLAIVADLWRHLGAANLATVAIGVLSLAALIFARVRLKPVLRVRGWSDGRAVLAQRAAPIAIVAAATFVTWLFAMQTIGVQIVGAIPPGLPPLTVPPFDPGLWQALFVPALLIAIVGFVESVSVARTLAARRRERIDPDRELVALGGANVAAAMTGGFPVTGGFARSVVNLDSGAATPAAGALTAVGILLATLLLTPLLHHLPVATLAATIIVAVATLVDLGAVARTWAYARQDGAAMAATIVATLTAGVEIGVVVGVATSIGLHLWRTSRPHCAVVGLVPGTEHFRNVERHAVLTAPALLTLRVDESLYFPNARFLEDRIAALVAERPAVRDLVLMCPAVNHIDASALESLETINRNLRDAGVTFHLSEIKGPVMDRLKRSHLLDDLTGQVFLSQFDALRALAPEVARHGVREKAREGVPAGAGRGAGALARAVGQDQSGTHERAPTTPEAVMSVETTMREKLMVGLEPTRLDIVNESELHAGHRGSPGTGESHFRVLVVSPAFRGKSRIERHRMVNALLAEEVGRRVHALALTTATPEEHAASA